MSWAFYGQYTGPGWTGGERVPDGERGDFSVKPLDSTDALARAHDWAYANADDAKKFGDMNSYYAIIAAADKALLSNQKDQSRIHFNAN